MSDPNKPLEWYFRLKQHDNHLLDMEEWLKDNPPPEGTSQIRHAFDHRDEIFGEEEEA